MAYSDTTTEPVVSDDDGDHELTTDSTARPFDDKDGREEAMEQSLDDLIETLIEDAKAARESEVYKNWLDANSSFHDYSDKNALLIAMQHPGAKRVAGFNTWKNEFNRYVQSGESAIWIWRPNTVTSHKCPNCGNAPSYHPRMDDGECEHAGSDPDEWDFNPTDEWNKGEILCGFSPAPVYALEQTEGEALPELPTEATGNDDLLPHAKAAASNLGHSVEVVDSDDWNHEAEGFCKTHTNPVEIEVELSTPSNAASVLIHETAHAELHTDNSVAPTQTKEVEAESVAYIVCEHFGLDSDGSAFYLANWADDSEEEIKNRLTRIKQTARTIISEIEAEIEA